MPGADLGSGPSVPPERLRTDRMVLRCWEESDAPHFKRALDSSLPELQKWIPWALHEPSELAVLEARLRGYREEFFSGGNALYALMDPAEAEVLGGAGIYRRVGPDAIEIGYWTRSDLVGRGFATEATAALTRVAATLAGVQRIEIHCDPANAASCAIPRKLGYRERGLQPASSPSPSTGSRDLVVWELATRDARSFFERV